MSSDKDREREAARIDQISQSIEAALYWDKPKVRDAEDMRERLNLYWAKCQNNGELPSFEGLCVLLGIPVEDGKRWCKGDGCDKEQQKLMQQALAILEAIDSDLVTKGIIPQGVYIWRSKQYYNMREPTVLHDLAAASPLRSLPSMAEIQRRYLADLPETQALPEKTQKEG